MSPVETKLETNETKTGDKICLETKVETKETIETKVETNLKMRQTNNVRP